MNGPVSIIINPISGTGGRSEVARRRAEMAAAILRGRGIDGDVRLTEHPRHACDLARAAVAAGASLVVAWGGDGTVNEVAATLVFGGVPLGIVPAGSGNGLARALGLPLEPKAALVAALDGRDRVIDAGEIDGHLFFNLAGIGLDATVAHGFAATGLERRGFFRYLQVGARELFQYEADEYTVVVDGTTVAHRRALFVTVANGTEYGNRAVIAPHARLDDGRLDVVIVGDRSPVATLLAAPLVFAGQAARVPGVTMTTGVDVEIASARPSVYHVDGEPHVGGAVLKARVHPRALRVRVAG